MREPNNLSSSESDEKIVMPHRGGNKVVIILALVVVTIVIIAAAFAAGLFSGGGSKECVTITGAGATFPMPLILKWADEYYNETDGKVKINYGGGGSGAGITQIKEKHVDFAGADGPLSAKNATTYGLGRITE